MLERVARRADELDAIVIDEFQNTRNPDVQTQIIEVVKGFSDHDVDVRIVIAGVADSDDGLLTSREYQQYKGRHFFAHRVPRMSASTSGRKFSGLSGEWLGVRGKDTGSPDSPTIGATEDAATGGETPPGSCRTSGRVY